MKAFIEKGNPVSFLSFYKYILLDLYWMYTNTLKPFIFVTQHMLQYVSKDHVIALRLPCQATLSNRKASMRLRRRRRWCCGLQALAVDNHMVDAKTFEGIIIITTITETTTNTTTTTTINTTRHQAHRCAHKTGAAHLLISVAQRSQRSTRLHFAHCRRAGSDSTDKAAATMPILSSRNIIITTLDSLSVRTCFTC